MPEGQTQHLASLWLVIPRRGGGMLSGGLPRGQDKVLATDDFLTSW
jgi:hypothetical protein